MNKLNSLCCPITNDTYKKPVIIPSCGHTFDSNALEEYITNYCKYYKKCPLCRKPMNIEFIDECPINWAIVDLLELDMNKNDNIKTAKYFKLLNKNHKKYMKNFAITIVDKFINDKQSSVKNGCSFLFFDCSKYSLTERRYIKKEFRKRKFRAKKYNLVLYKIKWQ